MNWGHVAHVAVHDKSSPKLAGAALIALGTFVAPMGISIPLIGIGVYKLLKKK